MKTNNIDVIIPCYNVSEEILARCLASIACQINAKDLKVTIVDDASTEENYEAIADRFSNQLDIQVLRYETNGGPGVARQYGLDHTTNGYVTFIDADDTFNGAFAVKTMYDAMNTGGKKHAMVSSTFLQVVEKPEDAPDDAPEFMFMEHPQDMVWVFGKMYRREFIDKLGIRFHPTSRANEDNGFNTIFRLVTTPENDICFVPFPTYYWHPTENSITRANDCEYSYGSSKRDSFYGYVENMIYAIKEARKKAPYNGQINMFAVDCMLNLYEYYIECYARAEKHSDQNWEYCKWFYEEIFKDIEKTIPEEVFMEQYNNMMRNAYMGNKLAGIIPRYGIKEFLAKMKEETEK